MPVIADAISALFKGRACLPDTARAIDSVAPSTTVMPRDVFLPRAKPAVAQKGGATFTATANQDPLIQGLDAKIDGICAKYGPFNMYGAGMRNLDPRVELQMKQDLNTTVYQSVFKDDQLRQTSEELGNSWSCSTSMGQEDLRAAWESVAQGHTPSTDLEKKVDSLAKSRAARWGRLAETIAATPSTEFQVYRGVDGDVFVQDVARAWADDAQKTLPVRAYSLSSWSLDKTIAEGFARQSGDRSKAVVFSARVPLEQTLMDKWSDGGTFVTRYPGQQEVVVATPQADALSMDKKDAVVFLNGVRYGYADREALLKQLNVKQPTIALSSRKTE